MERQVAAFAVGDGKAVAPVFNCWPR